MPSAFSERYRDIAVPVLDRWHDVEASVTYTPETGDAVTLDAVVHREEYTTEQPNDGIEHLVKRAKVSMPSDTVTTPNVAGDTVTLDGLEWAVESYQVSDGWLIVKVIRREVIEKAGAGYRQRV